MIEKKVGVRSGDIADYVVNDALANKNADPKTVATRKRCIGIPLISAR